MFVRNRKTCEVAMILGEAQGQAAKRVALVVSPVPADISMTFGVVNAVACASYV